jgi:ABC-type sulfate/molybdate transport systems ATPase subunit
VAAVPKFAAGPPAQVGIRAHHIDFLELSAPSAGSDNVFPCRLVATSESPFRVTLYVHLRTSPAPGTPYRLQAEVSKESWQKLREQPFPWHIRLSPEALFLMPE